MADILQEIQILSRKAEQAGFDDQAQYDCLICKDQGGYLDEGIEERDGRRIRVRPDRYVKCECVKKKRVDRLFKSSQITAEFQKMGFKNFVREGRPDAVQDAYECATAYYRNFHTIRNTRRNSIALLGTPGAGKTHLLTAIANCLMQTEWTDEKGKKKLGIPVLYLTWVDLLNELKDDFDLLLTKVQQMQQVEVLFIDDMFKGRKEPTPFQLEQLFAIVNYRYLNNKPMLISSERDIDQMCEIDEAIGSRIYDMCQDYTVLLKGNRKEFNYRLREA
ncbi:DnaA/Hda family protein [Aneurinibacillus migulanus]|nr:DnaA/Hda family protein [Aneurinibacillus migulanus]